MPVGAWPPSSTLSGVCGFGGRSRTINGRNRVIYLDNAATAMHKPQAVIDAVSAAMAGFGGVGRGVHRASMDAGAAVYHARASVAKLLGVQNAARVAFAHNATAALNVAIQGLLPAGARALTTAASHNSVLRPLFRVRDRYGCVVDVAPIKPDGSLDFEAFAALLEKRPALVAATHASNLTGDVYDVARMTTMAHDAGALFVLDVAQTAGAIPLNMKEIGADVLCFTGHKGMLGPQGTGGLAVAEGVDIEPLMEGGSGTHSYDERHPLFMPERLEAGTLNAHGLAGLAAGVDFLLERGVEASHEQVQRVAGIFESAARAIPGVRIVGGCGGVGRTGIVALNVGDVDSALVADALVEGFDICTRAGAHCAPLMHEALGTKEQGAVRFSFGIFNTEDEARAAAAALAEIAEEVQR